MNATQADRPTLERFVRDETLVTLEYRGGEDLLERGYIDPSGCVCLLTRVLKDGVIVCFRGSEWLFRCSDHEGLYLEYCPVLVAVTPLAPIFGVDEEEEEDEDYDNMAAEEATWD
jgi:hypothetical protein